MKAEYSSFDRFTFWLAGTDRDAIKTGCLSDSDISEQKNFGYAVAISVVIAFNVSLLLFGLVLKGIGKPESYAYIATFVWAAFVCYTDRMLFKKMGSQLYVRLVMLAFNAVVMSIGYQIYESDAQIDQYIRNEAGTINKSVYEERDKNRKVLTDNIDGLEEQIREIWNDPTIKYKTKMAKAIQATIDKRNAELQKFDEEQKAIIANLTHEPDLSFSHKAKVFWDKFLFQSFFGVLVSLLVIFFEGLPLGLRFANHRSDYLAFMQAKSHIPMGQWRKMTATDKIRFYLEVQKRNQRAYERDDDDERDENNNHKANPKEDLFPPFTFENA